ncbi:MAG TPA: tetratricopeptide repeat protein [Gammaproteobacteria bacterium]|nr:tetratricopeptide repeat protein [Gammaproteobacteria bacterium]
MMNAGTRLLAVGGVVLLAAGCASRQAPAPTLAALAQRPFTLSQGSAPRIAREQAVDSYRSFLRLNADPQLQREAQRRIADLSVESAQAARLRAQQAPLSPETDRQLQAAIELYRTYLEAYPDDDQAEQILYQLAKAYALTGDTDHSLATLTHLVQRYPHTHYYAEAQFRRGEILFARQEYEPAASAYQGIIDGHQGSVYYERALYKRGWSEYRQRRYTRGLESFFALLDLKLAQGKLREDGPVFYIAPADRELVDDTLRVIALTFANEDGARSAVRYFTHYGARRYEALVYLQLGDLYLKRERIADAAQTYQTFVQRHPDHALAPNFQENVINAFETGGFPSRALPATEYFVGHFGPDSRFWQTHAANVLAQIAPYLTVHVRDLAAHYHSRARRTHAAADFLRASYWYRTYLKWFPDNPNTAHMNFQLGECLNEAHQYPAAIAAYERTAYDYPRHKESAEAGYAALLSFAALRKTVTDSSEQATWRERNVASALRFANTFPNDPRVPPVLADTAHQLYSAGDFNRTVAVARQLLSQPALKRAGAKTTELRTTGLLLAAHGEFAQGRFAAAEQDYRRALALLNRRDKTWAPTRDRLAASIYKQGEQAERAGQPRAAVAHFLRLGQTTPNAGMRSKAEYDAAALLIGLQEWTRARRVLEDMRQRYPHDPLQAGVTEKLALVYRKSGHNYLAAREMEAISRRPGEPDDQRPMLWQAAALYEQSGHPKRARTAYRHYLERFAQPFVQSIDARQRLADLSRTLGDARARRHWLTGLVKAERAGGQARTEHTGELAARASLELAETAATSYRAVSLTPPLKKSLRRKKRLLQTAITNYKQALDYGVAGVTTAATYGLGELYYDFSKSLLSSPRPKRLSDEALEQYSILLEEQAEPFEEKAIAIHDTNRRRMADGLYDQWIEKSLQTLRKLRPVTYAKQERHDAYVAEIR